MAPASANATTVANTSTQLGYQITTEEAQKALAIIQSHTNGTDGRFDFSELIADGVPEQIAIEYAGVLEAAGEEYKAPLYVRSRILAEADAYRVSAQAVKASTSYSARGFDWGEVLRVAGSYVECMVIRNTLLALWPFAYCKINSDKNGTWIVIMY